MINYSYFGGGKLRLNNPKIKEFLESNEKVCEMYEEALHNEDMEEISKIHKIISKELGKPITSYHLFSRGNGGDNTVYIEVYRNEDLALSKKNLEGYEFESVDEINSEDDLEMYFYYLLACSSILSSEELDINCIIPEDNEEISSKFRELFSKFPKDENEDIVYYDHGEV